MADIKDDLSEPERRALVQRIAERGTRSETIKETTVKPSYDYSKAAEAAIAGDPVDLPPAALAELTDTVSAPAADASRYANAQAEIFKRGQGRELATGQQFFDDKETQVQATNFKIAEYDEDMRAAAAERAAAASRGRSYGGGSTPSFSFDPGVYEEEEADTGVSTDNFNGHLNENQTENFFTAVDTLGPFAGGAEQVVVTMKAQGSSWDEIRNAMVQSFTNNGIDGRAMWNFIQGMQAAYFPDTYGRGSGGPGPGGRF